MPSGGTTGQVLAKQSGTDYDAAWESLVIPSTAAEISFDNTGTGMTATDVQDAVTELKSNLTELMDITQWNHESVSVTPTSADSTWRETSAFDALKTAKIVAVCTGDLQAIFLNSGGQKIQTFSFMYSASNLTQYSAVIQLRIDFNTGKAGIRQSYKGSSASFSTLTDIYYI